MPVIQTSGKLRQEDRGFCVRWIYVEFWDILTYQCCYRYCSL